MKERRSSPFMLSETQAALVLLLPFFAVYFCFLVYPFAQGLWISLHDWNLLKVAFNPSAKEFVGLENYRRLFWGRDVEWHPLHRPVPQGLGFLALALVGWGWRRWRREVLFVAIVMAGILIVGWGFHLGEDGRWFDRRFWPTVARTVTFVALTVPLIVIISLLLAAALNQRTRAMAVLRTLFFVSQVLSVTVVTLIWQIMFSPRQGLIANVFEGLSVEPLTWLTNEHLAMPALVITTVWWSIGIAVMLFLAGLQDINPEIYEASEMDGATAVQSFFLITIPNIGTTLLLVSVLQIVLHFQVFGQSHLMTGGGPNDETQVLVRYIYQTAFRDSEMGRASAMAMTLFVIIGGFSLLQFLLGRRRQ